MAKKNAGMCAEDKKWQARSDMRTLVEAQEIQADASRMKAAKAAAEEEAKKANKVASSIKTY